MKKSAFTLIELLVVIAIIALLAGIALPVFNRAQERARATNCAGNLRQLGLGMQSYLNDNDDSMFTRAATGGGNASTWPETLHKKYVPSWKVFRSPFDKITRARPDTEKEPVPVSYGINSNCFDANASKFAAPTQLVMAAPAMIQGTEIDFGGTSSQNVELPLPTGGKKRGTHSGRSQINVLFADSSVRSMPYLEFSTSQQEEGLRRWYPSGDQPQQP